MCKSANVFVLLLLANFLFVDGYKFTSINKLLKLENSDISDLSTDILAKQNSISCYSVITNINYSSIINENFFKTKRPSFKIKTSESEDLLSPNYKTVKSLLEIRKAGCDIYLIFFSNGYQTERFLRFGEKHRILDTRAKFILLHDYRLFSQRLHYIWKRIINIIFIKQFKSKNQSKNNWFEISTLPFPLPNYKLIVTKTIDFWRSGKYQYGIELFKDKTKNLQGQLMKIAVLEHIPAVVKNNYHPIYTGVEVEILKSLASAMNFSYNLYESFDSENEKWGREQANGKLSGLLGEMVNKGADFGLGDLHYTPYNLESMDLSIPYNAECLTFITPESSRDNSWKILLLPFKKDLWIGVLISLFSVGFVFYGFTRFHIYLQKKEIKMFKSKRKNKSPLKNKKLFNCSNNESIDLYFIYKNSKKNKKKSIMLKDIFNEFSNCIMYTYSMLLVVSLPRLPRNWSIRLLTGWYWVYCLLIVVSYRASMTAILANPAPKVTIDTLEQLSKSNLITGAWGDNIISFFKTSLDESLKLIGAKMQTIENVSVALDNVIKGKYAYYENEYFLYQLRYNNNNVGNDGDSHSLHIMRSCVIHMPISLGLQKNSPIKQRVDKFLRRIIETGLVNKWLSDVTSKISYNEEHLSQEGLMNLKKLYGGIIALLVGYSLAFIIIFCEKIHSHYKYSTGKIIPI